MILKAIVQGGTNMKVIDRDGDAVDGAVLCEADFFLPEDGRVYESGIVDIEGGDNFADYSRWFWSMYGDDIYDDF